MGKFISLIVGAAIGLGCGVIPLVVGILTKQKLTGIIGIVSCTVGGVLFAVLEKPPITSISIAALFLIVIFMTKKKEEHHPSDNIEKGIYAESFISGAEKGESLEKDEKTNSENDDKSTKGDAG